MGALPPAALLPLGLHRSTAALTQPALFYTAGNFNNF